MPTTSFSSPAVTSELPRDRWGRPLITPPDGGDPQAYTRVTTMAHAIENTYHLGKWAERMVALGMAKRKDLVLSGAAITDPDDRSQKKTLQDIANRAKDSAIPSAASIGTALHTFTELQDKGLPLGDLPEEYAADLVAYKEATAALDVHSIEEFVVHDTYRVGGTYDRIYVLTEDMRLPEALASGLIAAHSHSMLRANGVEANEKTGTATILKGTAVIGDVKTGKSVDFGAASFSIQLGTYANSLRYVHTTGARYEHPADLSRILGLVVHLPAGKGRASLHWLRIDLGWSMIETCHEVRLWQARKDLIHEAVMVSTDGPTVVEMIQAAASVPELERIYRLYKASWTPGLTSMAAEKKTALLAESK